jgi:hypothetical protein
MILSLLIPPDLAAITASPNEAIRSPDILYLSRGVAKTEHREVFQKSMTSYFFSKIL